MGASGAMAEIAEVRLEVDPKPPPCWQCPYGTSKLYKHRLVGLRLVEIVSNESLGQMCHASRRSFDRRELRMQTKPVALVYE